MVNAVWDSAYVNALPDSAFACPDERKYPHHSKSGTLDLPHLRAALSRVGDPGNDQCGKAHLMAHAKTAGIGDHDIDADQIDTSAAEAPVIDEEKDEQGSDDEAKEKQVDLDPANDDSLAEQEVAKSAGADTTDESQSGAEELKSDPEATTASATQTTPDQESAIPPEGVLASGFDLVVNTYRAQLQERDEQISQITKERTTHWRSWIPPWPLSSRSHICRWAARLRLHIPSTLSVTTSRVCTEQSSLAFLKGKQPNDCGL